MTINCGEIWSWSKSEEPNRIIISLFLMNAKGIQAKFGNCSITLQVEKNIILLVQSALMVKRYKTNWMLLTNLTNIL